MAFPSPLKEGRRLTFELQPPDANFRVFHFEMNPEGAYRAVLWLGDQSKWNLAGTLKPEELEDFWRGLETCGAWSTRAVPQANPLPDTPTYLLELERSGSRHRVECRGSDHPGMAATLAYLDRTIVGRWEDNLLKRLKTTSP